MTFTTLGAGVWKTLVETLNQDRLTNFTTDTNRTPTINIYLINKIEVTSFYNTIRRATDVLSKYRYTNKFTNKNKFTIRFSNNITEKFT